MECACEVRSCNGLMVHVFGKLAAALFFWIFFTNQLLIHIKILRKQSDATLFVQFRR
jgi:hypothetical protein